MIASDAQKYFTLRLKRDLITDGMYRFIRHPNYLGEMMNLRQLWPDGLALAAVCSARVGLGRTICREHDSQGSQHVAVPRMETVQETLVVAIATGGLDRFSKYSE